MENAAAGLPLPFLIDVTPSISWRPRGRSGVAFACISIGILQLTPLDHHRSITLRRRQEEVLTFVVFSQEFTYEMFRTTVQYKTTLL
jgi:hypothetical protein